jgi:hypothetical protein
MANLTNRSNVETFTIPVQNISKLEERIEKLNKRARKIGIPEITMTVQNDGGPYLEASDEGEREVYDVEIDGEAPIIEGWQFIATLEHDEDGTIIRRIPTFSEDEFDLTQYRNATPETCDHCGYKRRRNDTYIVGYVGHEGNFTLDDTVPAYGDTKQVGSNCLKDFTGHESPQQIAAHLQRLRELLDDLRGGGYTDGGFVPRYSTRDYMASVVALARAHGFVSKKTAWEDKVCSTAEEAADYMTAPVERPADNDYEWADKIISWAEGLSEDDLDNDYLWNVHTVLKNGSLTARQFGIAASATQAYKRAQADRHIGTEGSRVEITFTVERVFDNTAYKTYILRERRGASLKWMTNEELEVGATYRGTFNVKAHITHDKYGKQTMINYPRDLERLSD